MQKMLKVIYPDQCVSCGELVAETGALCGACWPETPFIGGTVCNMCGMPLVGDQAPEDAICDDCIAVARPWRRGRAALLYRDNARRLVLALKHGDRLELVRPAARWMARAGAAIIASGMLAVPVPAHPFRLLRRRHNQAALLAQELARIEPVEYLPDALIRSRRTPVLDGLSRDERFRCLADAIRPHPRRAHRLSGASILLIDDVMTSGATLGAAAEAVFSAGAKDVAVLVLARVAKDA